MVVGFLGRKLAGVNSLLHELLEVLSFFAVSGDTVEVNLFVGSTLGLVWVSASWDGVDGEAGLVSFVHGAVKLVDGWSVLVSLFVALHAWAGGGAAAGGTAGGSVAVLVAVVVTVVVVVVVTVVVVVVGVVHGGGRGGTVRAGGGRAAAAGVGSVFVAGVLLVLVVWVVLVVVPGGIVVFGVLVGGFVVLVVVVVLVVLVSVLSFVAADVVTGQVGLVGAGALFSLVALGLELGGRRGVDEGVGGGEVFWVSHDAVLGAGEVIGVLVGVGSTDTTDGTTVLAGGLEFDASTIIEEFKTSLRGEEADGSIGKSVELGEDLSVLVEEVVHVLVLDVLFFLVELDLGGGVASGEGVGESSVLGGGFEVEFVFTVVQDNLQFLLAVTVVSGEDSGVESLLVVVSVAVLVLVLLEVLVEVVVVVVVSVHVGHEDVPVVLEVSGESSVVKSGGESLVSDTGSLVFGSESFLHEEVEGGVSWVGSEDGGEVWVYGDIVKGSG